MPDFNNTRIVAPLFLAYLTFAGCLIGPNYEKPQTEAPTTESFLKAPAAATNVADVAHGWWKELNDPMLNRMITAGLSQNLDLAIGLQRIRQARARLAQSDSSLWPSLDASGSAVRSRSWGGSNPSGWGNLWRAGFDAAWEIDIFGGVRRGIESAQASAAAQVYTQADMEVALAAEIATVYLDVRMRQDLLWVTQSNLVSQTHSAEITRKLYKAEMVSGLDMANAEALVSSTTAQIPTMEAALADSILELENLLGELPYTYNEALRTELTFPTLPAALPGALPNDLLRRRPDIRAAEENVKAACADIGVAEAEFYPKFSLAGSIGLSAPNLSHWSDAARSISFGPAFSWNLFNAGRIRAQVEERKALWEQSVLTYQKTVLAAWQECESAWQGYTQETYRSKPLEEAVTQNERALTLAKHLYTVGMKDYTDVLITQRSLLTAQDALARHRSLLFQKLIAVYKALGGGWKDPEA